MNVKMNVIIAFKDRLKRDKPKFLNVDFDVDISMQQQEIYLDELESIKNKYKNINCYELNTSNKLPKDIVQEIMWVVKK